MVICDGPVIEVCPVEHARMPNRTVLQWDKDDCAAAGLVKFDLLGLGMLSALHGALDLVRDHRGYEIDLARLPHDDQDVYDMLCRADTVGVFQVESRAQMATLPRLKPKEFYDLVVEVALIRPGPIQGGSVHPYIRRRNGLEPVTYPHPLAKKCLERTKGVPLFQEQLMQLAIDLAGFSPGEADELRQAMGSKRSAQRMERLKERLYAGMAERGITGEVADDLYVKMRSFANYGFPESHSVSFAYLVYASAYLKHYEPAAFCAALLNAQPMGFWSPHTLVRDARRHGVQVRTPDLNASPALATLQPCPGSTGDVAVRLAARVIHVQRQEADRAAELQARERPFLVQLQEPDARETRIGRVGPAPASSSAALGDRPDQPRTVGQAAATGPPQQGDHDPASQPPQRASRPTGGRQPPTPRPATVPSGRAPGRPVHDTPGRPCPVPGPSPVARRRYTGRRCRRPATATPARPRSRRAASRGRTR